MSTFLKPTVIANTALGLLVRAVTLPRLVWRDPVADRYIGALNDTVSIRLPAFVTANERALRSGDPRTKTSLYERKVDITLDTDIYVQTDLPDEMLELDISNFGTQVLDPIVGGIGRKIDDKLAAAITGASYENTIAFVRSTDTPYKDVAVPARMYLNNAYVPAAGRVLVCGSDLEAAILTDDQFIRADHIGDSAEGTVREGRIGRIAGFDVYGSDTCPVIPADEGYAFHYTAYALTLHAPRVPAGAQGGWSASGDYEGMAMRVLRFFDQTSWQDSLGVDSWLGTAVVTDEGHFTDDPDAGGKFVPVDNPEDPITGHTDDWLNDDERLIRAVKITVS
jgi:P22 coat protein - gene protein 5